MHSALRRALLTTALAGAFIAPAWADVYPSKPIALVVTQGRARAVTSPAACWPATWGPCGQTVVVENRAGASGISATSRWRAGTPDGYTVLFTFTAGLFVVPALNPNAKYSLADYVPVAPVVRAPFAVPVANTPAAPKTLGELISTLRAGPQSFASAGVGTMTHLGSELLLRKAGVQATHIPYKGSGAALTDLMGGQVLFATDSLTAAMTHIKSGKLRALATTDAVREGSLPDVPTLAEAGVPGVQVAVISGLFAPKGTPQDVVDKIAAATARALANPEVAQRLAAVETDPLKVNLAGFQALLRKEAEVWSPLVQQLGLKQE